MTDTLITIIIALVLIGTFLLCFAIDFTEMPDGEIESDVHWKMAVVGLALLFGAGAIAVNVWP